MRAHLILLPVFLLILSSACRQPDVVSYRCPAAQIRIYGSLSGSAGLTLNGLARTHPALRFGTNGGMYDPAFHPVGLLISEGRTGHGLHRVNNPNVNFGLQPQGVFGIRNGRAFIEPVNDFRAAGVTYATQSAPMLVIEGKRNPALPKGRQLTRNGVGLLRTGEVLLAVSESGLSFHEFADWFVRQGCVTALFLDGTVSDYYSPQHPSDQRFGVLIAVEADHNATIH